MLFTGVSRRSKIRIQTVSTVMTGGELETKTLGSCAYRANGFTCDWKETSGGETWDVYMTYRDDVLYIAKIGRGNSRWSQEVFDVNKKTRAMFGNHEGVISMEYDTLALSLMRVDEATHVIWTYDVFSGGELATEMMCDVAFEPLREAA